MQGRLEKSGEHMLMSREILLGDDGNALKSILVVVAQRCDYTQKHSVVHFKWVNCVLWKLYLRKAK